MRPRWAQFRQFAVERAWASVSFRHTQPIVVRFANSQCCRFVCEAGFCAVIGNGRIRNEHHELGMCHAIDPDLRCLESGCGPAYSECTFSKSSKREV